MATEEVLSVTWVLPALTIGGLWRHLLNLRHRPLEGIHVDVIVIFDNPDNTNEPLPPGVPGLHLHVDPIDWCKSAVLRSMLIRGLRANQPHLVHTTHIYSDIYALPAAEQLGLPAMRSVHGIAQVTQADSFRKTQVLLDWRQPEVDLEMAADNACCRTIAVSHDLRQRLIRYGFRGEKIVVLHNGVEVDHFAPPKLGTRLEARRGLGIADTAVVIGFVGRFEPVKNPLAFLDIANELKNLPDVHFLIVGDGPLEQAIAAKVHDLQLDRLVTLVPMQRDIRRAYSSMDLLVQTSLTEGCSSVLLEGMAHGLPIVASSVGGTPEVIREGVDGYLFSSTDVNAAARMCRLLATDDQLRRRFGQNGRDRVVNAFDLGSYHARLSELYREVLTS